MNRKKKKSYNSFRKQTNSTHQSNLRLKYQGVEPRSQTAQQYSKVNALKKQTYLMCAFISSRQRNLNKHTSNQLTRQELK